MNFLGITLRRPGSNELTAACVMAVGLWVAGIGLMQASHMAMDRIDAGALLLVTAWACVAARLGIRIGLGGRHLLANVLVSTALLSLYQGVVALMS